MTRPLLAVTAALIAVTGLTVGAERARPPAPVAASAVASGDPAEVALAGSGGPVGDVREVTGGGGSFAAPRHGGPAPARSRPAPAFPHGRVRWDGRAFATPEAAMRFLTRAYNTDDDDALRHVTTPDARRDLAAMRDIAPTLTLARCRALPSGAYDCAFTHSYVTGGDEGSATFRVAPAARPGWYMTVLEECG